MATPNLGYGKQTEASIDTVNRYMRAQPWYRAIRGTAPKINDTQRKQILRAAQANGIQVDEGDLQIDSSGNFDKKSNAVRNTLIVAGIAGATIATMGAAGAFAAAGGMAGGAAGGAASGAAAAGSTAAGLGVTTAGIGTGGLVGGTAASLGSAAIGTGAIGGIAGGTGLAGGTAAALGGGGALTTVGGVAPLIKETVTRNGIGGSGIGYADALKYGGGIVNGVMQHRAASSAEALQQKYLEDALAYQKEQDAYARSSAEERQQYDRGLASTALAKEDSRYADYQGRIGGFISNGQNSNDRMAALLGLPAGMGGGGGRSAYRPAVQPVATPQSTAAWAAFDQLYPGEELTPAMLTRDEAKLKALGFSLRPNAAGVVGKIQYGQDPIADVIQGAGSGLNRKQRLYG